MKRALKDGVFEDKDTGFWHCRVEGQVFGPWRFRGEAEGGLKTERRRAQQRAEAGTAMKRAGHDPNRIEPTPLGCTRDQFRSRFVFKLSSMTAEELLAQRNAVIDSTGEADTVDKRRELARGLSLIDAVGNYRFGLGWERHRKVAHGRCSVCGHYGNDCTGS